MDSHKVTKKEAFLKSDTSQVDYIKIQNEHGELVMRRVGATWKITEPIEWKANPSYIKTLLEKLAGLKLESEITSNEDKYVLYELDGAAAKYVEIGKEGGVVRISARTDAPDILIIEVADNGPGVSANASPHIFEPFFSTKGAQGTGLGLAVTRKIIVEHQGRISVSTAPEGGALFTITLPCGPAKETSSA